MLPRTLPHGVSTIGSCLISGSYGHGFTLRKNQGLLSDGTFIR